jgi:hypothetical protein
VAAKIHPFSSILVGFIAGLKKHYAGQTVLLDGKSWAVDALEAFFQTGVDAVQGASDAAVAKTKAVKLARDTVAQVRPVANAFKKAVLAAYGSDAIVLADFDLTAPKQAVKPVAVKDAAAKKAKATREALRTMGPKQKAKAKKDLAASQAGTPAAPAPAPGVSSTPGASAAPEATAHGAGAAAPTPSKS